VGSAEYYRRMPAAGLRQSQPHSNPDCPAAQGPSPKTKGTFTRFSKRLKTLRQISKNK